MVERGTVLVKPFLNLEKVAPHSAVLDLAPNSYFAWHHSADAPNPVVCRWVVAAVSKAVGLVVVDRTSKMGAEEVLGPWASRVACVRSLVVLLGEDTSWV